MNLFYGLETPAADGVGAARDVSASGKTKTFMVTGTFVCTITVEASNDGTSYFPVFSMSNPGKKTVELPCQWMRVRVSGFLSGQGAVDIAATDEGVKLANLPVSAGDGTGTAVDVSDFGTTNSIIIGGTWTGVVTLEISEDGLVWSQLISFTRNALKVMDFVTNYIRVRRAGNSTGTPNVDIAAQNDDNPETNLFGDGTDGDVTLAAPTTLTRDMYYDTLDVADQTLNTAGFRIFCKTELRIGASGLVHCNGNAGAAEVGGAAIAAAMLGASAAGGNGAIGAGANGGALAQCIGGQGGDGGDGGGGAQAGGTAGAATGLTTAEPTPQSLAFAQYPCDCRTGTLYTGGTGGGGGGGDGVADEGGGGGGGGGIVVISARKINLAVSATAIQARGGAGAAGTAADCGGGGGGGGGCIILVYRTLYAAGTIDANGGAGGASGGGTGSAGDGGDAGAVYYNQV